MGLFVQSRKTRILCTSRRPIDGASIGRRTLHVPRCSLHSAAAINYTQSHTRRDTSLPSHIPSARQTLSLPSTYNASLLLTFSTPVNLSPQSVDTVLYDSSHDYLFQSATKERLPILVKTDLDLSLLELQAYIER